MVAFGCHQQSYLALVHPNDSRNHGAESLCLFFHMTPRIQTDVDDKKVRYHDLTFTTLEMRRERGVKWVPRLFLGSLLGTRRSAIGQCFPRPKLQTQKSLRKSTHPTLKWQIGTLRSEDGNGREKVAKKVNSRSFMQSSSRLLQVTNFAKCRQTLLKLKS